MEQILLKRILYILSVCMILLFLSCNDRNEDIPETNISVYNEVITDLGRNDPPLSSFLVEDNNSTKKFEIITPNIKKGDGIESISMLQKNRCIEIRIRTSPNDFNCTDCFSNHRLTFNIESTKLEGNYNIVITLNNVTTSPFKYTFY